MNAAEGFDFRARATGDVAIFHHGKLARLLRGDAAAAFLDEVGSGDPQEVMARTVGNDGQHSHPGGGPQGPASAMHGNGDAHSPREFRRKSG